MEDFVACFAEVIDPRQDNARHDLHEILMIALCTMLCGGEDCSDMPLFGQAKEPFLRQFLTLKHGIPSHDTFSRVFRLLDPVAFAACFTRFMYRLADTQRPADATHCSVDGDHGRIETRTSLVCTDIDWLRERHEWPGLAAIGQVVRVREVSAKVTTETAYYPLSSALSAERFGEVARAHWGIENGLHWVLDVTMNEDQARNRKDHGPENIALLRRLALNLAKLEGSKGSMKGKLKRAGWNDAFLAKLLASFGSAQMR